MTLTYYEPVGWTPPDYKCSTLRCQRERPLKRTETELHGLMAHPGDRRCTDCVMGRELAGTWRLIHTRKHWRCGRCQCPIPSHTTCWAMELGSSSISGGAHGIVWRVCGDCRDALVELRERYVSLSTPRG